MFQRIASPTHGVFQYVDVDVGQLPSVYPTTAGIEQDGTRTNVFGSEELLFRFRREDGTLRPLHEVAARPYYSEEGLLGTRLVRPKVGTDAIGPPSEFLTLYALLFCLSELARYVGRRS